MLPEFIITLLLLIIILGVIYRMLFPPPHLTYEQIKKERFFLGSGTLLILFVTASIVIAVNQYLDRSSEPPDDYIPPPTPKKPEPPKPKRKTEYETFEDSLDKMRQHFSDDLKSAFEKVRKQQEERERLEAEEEQKKIDEYERKKKEKKQEEEAERQKILNEKRRLDQNRSNTLPQCLKQRLTERRSKLLSKINSRWRAINILLDVLPKDVQNIIIECAIPKENFRFKIDEGVLFYIRPDINTNLTLREALIKLLDAEQEKMEIMILLNWNAWNNPTEILKYYHQNASYEFDHFWKKTIENILPSVRRTDMLETMYTIIIEKLTAVKNKIHPFIEKPWKLNAEESCTHLMNMLDNIFKSYLFSHMALWYPVFQAHVEPGEIHKARRLSEDVQKNIKNVREEFWSASNETRLVRGPLLSVFGQIIFKVKLPEPEHGVVN